MGFSLEWLLKLRGSELNNIELELIAVNTKLSDNLQKQEKNRDFLEKLKGRLSCCNESWEIHSLTRSIGLCDKIERSLRDDMLFLQKEKEMVYEKYQSKNKEIQLLEKVKEAYTEELLLKKSRREQAEINEMSLLKERMRIDE